MMCGYGRDGNRSSRTVGVSVSVRSWSYESASWSTGREHGVGTGYTWRGCRSRVVLCELYVLCQCPFDRDVPPHTTDNVCREGALIGPYIKKG